MARKSLLQQVWDHPAPLPWPLQHGWTDGTGLPGRRSGGPPAGRCGRALGRTGARPAEGAGSPWDMLPFPRIPPEAPLCEVTTRWPSPSDFSTFCPGRAAGKTKVFLGRGSEDPRGLRDPHPPGACVIPTCPGRALAASVRHLEPMLLLDLGKQLDVVRRGLAVGLEPPARRPDPTAGAGARSRERVRRGRGL